MVGLPVAVFLEQRQDFAAQACSPRLDEALHVDQEATLLTVRVARHEVLYPWEMTSRVRDTQRFGETISILKICFKAMLTDLQKA